MSIVVKYRVKKLTMDDEEGKKLPFIVYAFPDRTVNIIYSTEALPEPGST